MDNIQKELIKAGRKDLAQEYYKKISSFKSDVLKEKGSYYKVSDNLSDLLNEVLKIFSGIHFVQDQDRGIFARKSSDTVLYYSLKENFGWIHNEDSLNVVKNKS
jgi:hypothetical protein